ncbi:AAA family ATPase [Bosea sp. (in: a-proteobacteria)]|jgi:ATP-dependent Lon protease|uniref:AAA family ATPase n=1 Tax=Bosea sp. (in: a-proteobacteria) TaxID=1871050 RepID=UPI002DDD764A|nr:AAA family ATPase [Bosea sp. (in: a-proteobacteria)]HEV2510369.1 AAA family ATPase [Bosea sp. (in: a-proteobacteria)]
MSPIIRRPRRKRSDAIPPTPPEAIGLDLFKPRDLLQRLYADRTSATGDGEDDSAQAARQRALWLRLHEDERGARRSLIQPDAALLARIAALDLTCPQFSEVTAWILRAATLAMAGGQPLRLDPCVLLGPPGMGKTFYASKLAEAFGVSTLTIPMSTITDRGTWFTGLSPAWRAAGPGKIAQLLIDSDSASPVVVIDEIEKSSPINPSETPINVLHSLLERENARSFQDEFLEIPVRADAIIWIATANDLSPLPPSIVDRLITFEISLEPAQMLAIQRSLFGEANAATGGLFETPPEILLEELAALTPRSLSRLWPIAFGFACMASRRYVTRSDLARAEGVLGLDRVRKGRIGFLAGMRWPPVQAGAAAASRKSKARD